jgi:hypothetical protein
MNALSRPTDSVYNTMLILIEGYHTSRITTAESKRVELGFVHSR